MILLNLGISLCQALINLYPKWVVTTQCSLMSYEKLIPWCVCLVYFFKIVLGAAFTSFWGKKDYAVNLSKLWESCFQDHFALEKGLPVCSFPTFFLAKMRISAYRWHFTARLLLFIWVHIFKWATVYLKSSNYPNFLCTWSFSRSGSGAFEDGDDVVAEKCRHGSVN